MAFERACALAEIAADEGLSVTIGRYDVVVSKCETGDAGVEVFALQDLCSHQAVALSEGEVQNDGGECSIECWLHGSMFDLRTGKPTGLPATEPVSTFAVEIRGGDVFVDTDTTLNGVTPS